jgi:WD40 repeat protein
MRGELSLFDFKAGREVFRRQVDYDPVYALEIGPQGERVAVALRSSRVHVVDIETGEDLQALQGHRDSVYAVVRLGAGRLASGGKGKRLFVWDLSVPGSPPRLLYRGDHYITALAFDSTNGVLALTLDEDTLGVLDLETGRIMQRLVGHTAPVQALVFLDEGHRLLSAGNDSRIMLWSLAQVSPPTTAERTQ